MHFSARQNQMATVFKALGHPARLAIMEYVLKVNTCICGDIVNELPLAQPTISQHLRELKNAGLIKGNIEGNAVCYCVNEKVILQVLAYFQNFSEKLSKKNSCC